MKRALAWTLWLIVMSPIILAVKYGALWVSIMSWTVDRSGVVCGVGELLAVVPVAMCLRDAWRRERRSRSARELAAPVPKLKIDPREMAVGVVSRALALGWTFGFAVMLVFPELRSASKAQIRWAADGAIRKTFGGEVGPPPKR